MLCEYILQLFPRAALFISLEIHPDDTELVEEVVVSPSCLEVPEPAVIAPELKCAVQIIAPSTPLLRAR